jgi:hypothetical protein
MPRWRQFFFLNQRVDAEKAARPRGFVGVAFAGILDLLMNHFPLTWPSTRSQAPSEFGQFIGGAIKGR